MLRRILLVGLFGPVLAFGWVSAAFATLASASLDWSQFRIDVLGIAGYPAPGWSFIEQAGFSSTNALTVGDSSDSHTRTTFNWSSATQIESVTPAGRGSAVVSGQGLEVRALSTGPVIADGPFSYQNTASAQARRTGVLHLDGPAAVAFSAPYDLEVQGPPFDFDDYATAGVSGTASFQPEGGFFGQSASRSFSLDSRFPPGSAPSGLLIFGVVVDGGGTLSFALEANAASFSRDVVTQMTPVPEPAAALQVLAGLLAAAAVALRRSRFRGSA